MRRRKILHCITDLSPDGAQRTLLRLTTGLARSDFESRVISLLAGGHLISRFEGEGVPVVEIGVRRGIPDPRAFARLSAAIRQFAPDVIHGWQYHGNLAATIGARLAGSRAPVLWNIRRCLPEGMPDKLSLRVVRSANALLSSKPDRIVYCVRRAASDHEAIGFDPSKRLVIPNGIDTERFRPDAESRMWLRESIGVSSDCPVVGIAGRYHPLKDFLNFLLAANRVAKGSPGAHFVLVGRGVETSNRELAGLVTDLSLVDRCHLLGERQDVARIISGLDVFVSSSRSEGFSNVVAEAMACGVPCVATSVGASPELLEGLGPIVPRCNHQALAEAICSVLERSHSIREETGRRSRERIAERYSLRHMIERYSELYLSAGQRPDTDYAGDRTTAPLAEAR